MTLLVHELERTDTRVLGALRCVDATTRVPVDGPLQLHCPGARLRRNRSGLVVVAAARGLEDHEAAFGQPPAAPPLGDVALAITIHDPLGRYLPRRVAMALPRSPDPALATTAASLFQPLEVAMLPAPSAAVGVNWSLLRVAVRDGDGNALGGALLRVTAGASVLARGLSDARGEALVAVPGVPVTTWNDAPGAVVLTELAAQLEVVFDPAQGTRRSAADLEAGQGSTSAPVVDPDDLDARRASLPRLQRAVALRSGQSQSFSVVLALP